MSKPVPKAYRSNIVQTLPGRETEPPKLNLALGVSTGAMVANRIKWSIGVLKRFYVAEFTVLLATTSSYVGDILVTSGTSRARYGR